MKVHVLIFVVRASEVYFHVSAPIHYENAPIQIYWKLHRLKLKIFSRGGSNEYPQSVFLSRNKKNNVYPCKPQFYYIKVGFNGVKII